MKKIIGLIVVSFILIMAAITNPSKDKFIIWAKDQMKNQSNNVLINWGIDVIGGSILSSVTSEQDYLFFTIYDAKITNSSEIRVLGLFNHFIPLSNGSTSPTSGAAPAPLSGNEATNVII